MAKTKKPVFTKETEFPRSCRVTNSSGEEIFSFVSHPYVSGLYLSTSHGQLSMKWKNLDNLVKTIKSKAKKNGDIVDFAMGELGYYLNEQEITIINS